MEGFGRKGVEVKQEGGVYVYIYNKVAREDEEGRAATVEYKSVSCVCMCIWKRTKERAWAKKGRGVSIGGGPATPLCQKKRQKSKAPGGPRAVRALAPHRRAKRNAH